VVPEIETLRFRAMNTDVLLAAQGGSARLAAGLEKAQTLVSEGEARFSRFLENSELTKLNRAAGTWFHVSPDMLAVLTLSFRYHHLTAGLFDPSILPDLRRAGYDRSMDLLRAQDVLPAAAPALRSPRPAFGEMRIDNARRRVFLPKGMALDLGGIAKGWIVEQAALALAEYAESCAVDAGGDLFLAGAPYGTTRWPVALDDPRRPGDTLLTLSVPPGGVATSTTTKRAWRQNTPHGEVHRHHLIDPRSGEPSTGDWLSVTVISAHTHLSEVFAKALLIAGPLEAGQLQLNETSLFSYLAVDREGKLAGAYQNMEISHGG